MADEPRFDFSQTHVIVPIDWFDRVLEVYYQKKADKKAAYEITRDLLDQFDAHPEKPQPSGGMIPRNLKAMNPHQPGEGYQPMGAAALRPEVTEDA